MMKVLLASSLLLPYAAQAAPGDCSTELGAVATAIESADYLGTRNADMNRSNLIAKLDAAYAKLDLDKFSDAIDKLLNISDKATAWADPDLRKPKLLDATGINEAVGDAITCVGTVGSSTL